MRVLFQTYALAFQAPGGGERVMQELRRALQARGHEVEIFSPWVHDPRDFDVLHYFSCLESSVWRHHKQSFAAVPLIVTPTLHLEDGWRSRWQVRGEHLRSRYTKNRVSDLRLPDRFLPATEREARSLRDFFAVPESRIKVQRNGVSRNFGEAKPDIFRARFGIEHPYLLHVGRFHPVKRQHFLIEALRNTNVSCVFIGGPDPAFPQYYEKCVREAKLSRSGNFRFVGAIHGEDPLLPSAYAGASLFALPSRFETFGLAALEAAIAGCPVVVSDGLADPGIFLGAASVLPVADRQGWRGHIERAFSSPNARLSPAITQRLRAAYDWDRIALELENEYESLRSSPSMIKNPARSSAAGPPSP